MARQSKLDEAIKGAMAEWEDAKANEKLTGAVLQALIDVSGQATDAPKAKRTRKPKGLPPEVKP